MTMTLPRYPQLFSYGLFSHEGPTEQQMKETHFSMTFVGRGFKDAANAASGADPDYQAIFVVLGPCIVSCTSGDTAMTTQ
jgi:hypothetical protein